MTGIEIFFLAVLCLFLLFQIRVGGIFQYQDGNPFLAIRIGRFKIKLFPQKKKKDKLPMEQVQPKKRKQREETSKDGKIRFLLQLAQEELPVILKAIESLKKKIRFDTLKLYIYIPGQQDPVSCTDIYGKLQILFATLWPPLNNAFTIKDGAIGLRPDFSRSEFDAMVDLKFSIKLASLFLIGLFTLCKGLSAFLKTRKKLKTQPIKT